MRSAATFSETTRTLNERLGEEDSVDAAGVSRGLYLHAGSNPGMLTLDLESFMFELKDGAIKHIGPSNKTATVKCYDVEDVEVREFGDERAKLAFTDEDGNEVEVALFPDEAREVARGVDRLDEESDIFVEES